MTRAPSRRDFLKAAGLAVGAQAVPLNAAPVVAADETLTNYGSHVADARSLTVTSATGQQLRITAYGGHIIRVRSIRSGEAFFADSRYEMVDPASHAGLGGTLHVADTGDAFTITTAPADGITAVLRKNPLRLEFSSRNDDAPLPAGSAVRIRATTTGASGGNLDSLSVG